MRVLTILALLFYFPVIPTAHPAWGIVVNETGEIIFSDLLKGEGVIWKMDKNGNVEKYIDPVHTHDLWLDKNKVLWGTDTRYFQHDDHWEVGLWKSEGSGQLEYVIGPEIGFKNFGGSNFVLDDDGNVYFIFEKQVYKRGPGGKVALFSDFRFERICTMAGDSSGSLFISDSGGKGKLYKIDPSGKVTLLANNLKEIKPKNPPFKEERFNLFFGMTIFDNHIYLTNSGSRRILKIDKQGDFSVFYQSEDPWYPVGITFHNENVYIKEAGFSIKNIGPRITKLDKNKKATILYNDGKKIKNHQDKNENPYLIFFIIILLLTFFIFIAYKKEQIHLRPN